VVCACNVQASVVATSPRPFISRRRTSLRGIASQQLHAAVRPSYAATAADDASRGGYMRPASVTDSSALDLQASLAVAVGVFASRLSSFPSV